MLVPGTPGFEFCRTTSTGSFDWDQTITGTGRALSAYALSSSHGTGPRTPSITMHGIAMDMGERERERERELAR
eukprot:2925259-Rhodomonas_salina.1